MPLTATQKRYLRAQAHHLNPVVMLGQHGLTAAVMQEVEIALDSHELIKIRISGADREDRAAIVARIGQDARAEVVQTIGHVAVLYRAHPQQPRIALPRH